MRPAGPSGVHHLARVQGAGFGGSQIQGVVLEPFHLGIQNVQAFGQAVQQGGGLEPARVLQIQSLIQPLVGNPAALELALPHLPIRLGHGPENAPAHRPKAGVKVPQASSASSASGATVPRLPRTGFKSASGTRLASPSSRVTTRTSFPASCKSRAAANPAMPAPMTTTSAPVFTPSAGEW